jgi:hypothetical protein
LIGLEKSWRIGERVGTSLEITFCPKFPKELKESMTELSVERESLMDSSLGVFMWNESESESIVDSDASEEIKENILIK